MEYVELNDVFFNQNTALKLDDSAKMIIEKIDESKLISKYKIESKFNGVVLDVDCLSTGCKLVLNVFYFPDKVFCFKECGNNALEVLYNLEKGFIYSNYAIIPLDVENIQIRACSGKSCEVIEDYEELKEWWDHEE